MKGRKPRPTALKLLDGTRADRINRDEPRFRPASIEAPAHLERNDQARAHWDELAPLLASAGLLTEGDRPALALLCECFALFRVDPGDFKARELYRKLLVEFGLTPSSRSRIKAPGERPRDAFAEFMGRKKDA